MKKVFLFLLIPVLASFSSCSVKLSGASIPAEMKTVSVPFIENNAPTVQPTLSQSLTEALKTRIRNQSRLNIVPSDANATFEGRITGYDIKPVAIQDNNRPTAGANRLTIRVNMKYTNNINPKQSFEESFERYYTFPAGNVDLNTVQATILKGIIDQLTDDIFNRAFAQW